MSVNNLDVRTIRFDKFMVVLFWYLMAITGCNGAIFCYYSFILSPQHILHTIALFPFSNNNADTSFADAFVIYPFFSVCFQSGMLNALIEGSLKSNF